MKSVNSSALVVTFVAAICVSCDGGTSGPDPVPVPGICNLQPNYVSQVNLNRWREFPLQYSLIESTFSNENRELTLLRIVEGINQWAVSTNGSIGSLVRISNTDEADLVIQAENLEAHDALARHATGIPFLSGGQIIFDRQTIVDLLSVEGGQPVAALAAHEMGHILGIIGHPSAQGVLMSTPIQASRPTSADINTLSHAYCRP